VKKVEMIERRFNNCSVRASQGDEGAMVISGLAARFGVLSHDLGQWRERIAQGAFTRSLRDANMDIIACREHDQKLILGRTKAGTLRLNEDGSGLRFRCELPNTQEGRDTFELIKRGDLQDCSFAFTCDEEDWNEETDPEDNSRRIPVRTLRSVTIRDVSVVSAPAYPLTSVGTELSSQNNPSLGNIGGRSLASFFPEGVPAEARSHVAAHHAEVTLNAEAELENAELELGRLSRQNVLTRSEQKRVDALVSVVANASRSLSRDQRRNLAIAKLEREAGPMRHKKLSPEVEKEFRGFLFGREVPKKYQHEERAYTANVEGAISLTASNAAGATFIAPEIFDSLLFSMKQHDAIFDADSGFSNRVITPTQAVLPLPAVDDVTGTSYLCGEGTKVTEIDLANSSLKQLNAYKFSSGLIVLSAELLQDGYWPWADLILKAAAGRHARGIGQYLMTGTGINQPLGLLVATLASGVSPIIASGSSANTGGAETGATSIGSQDFNALYKSLNAAVRSRSSFYMRAETLDAFQNLLDKNGRPLISYRKAYYDDDGDYPVLMNRPVCLSPSMPAMASASNPVLFGAGDPYFITRFVKDSYFQRFQEAPGLVENGLIAFASYMRCDSQLLPSPTVPVFSYLQMHS
jgi:HK97 family phage major capsid protein/HK97 family phage prohead protease